MAVVYRYKDLADDKIKYVGIVYGKSRTLEQRIREHSRDDKFKNHIWLIEYFNVKSRTDAEALEGHLIALYETYEYLNVSKRKWGLSEYLPSEFDWVSVDFPDFSIAPDKILKGTCATIISGMPITCGLRGDTRYYDCKLMNELPQDWQKLCNKWVKTRLTPAKTKYWDTSYGLKHLLEHDLGIYLTNNQFKHLLLMNGYSPLSVDEFNWKYNLKVIKKPSRFLKWCNEYVSFKRIAYCYPTRIVGLFIECLREHSEELKESHACSCNHIEYREQQASAIFDDIDNLRKFYRIIMSERGISEQNQEAVLIYFLELYKIYEASKGLGDKEIKEQLNRLHSWYEEQERNKNYPYCYM